MRGLLKYIKPYGFYMLLTLCLKFTAALMDLLIPSLLAKIIDASLCGCLHHHKRDGKPHGGGFGRGYDKGGPS